MSYEFDIVSKIKSLELELKSSEKKVGHLILSDLQWAGNASITELAEGAGVSEATITRFAKAVGCKNVRDLKAAIVSSYAIGQRFIEGHSEKTDESTMGQVIKGIHQALQNASDQISDRSLKEAAAIINTCKQLVVFGSGGGSTMVALDAQHRLFRLGITVSAHHDTIMQRMIAATLDKDCAVLIVSTTGEIDEINQNAKVAKQYGAKIISITRASTELSKLSDVHLHVHVHEAESIFKATPSRYALLAAVDAIALEVANMRQDECKEILRRMKYNLDSLRGSDQRFPVGD